MISAAAALSPLQGMSPHRPAGDGNPRTIPSGRRKKSCDYCTKRKRRCDGKTPCSFCIAKNQPECHYSVRLLTGPKADSASKRASKGPGVAGKGGAGGGRVSTGNRRSAVVPLKRARLSPSAATGLVGMRENVFIEEFFRTMGFLPFTTESFIRKAMVRTMFRAVQERNPRIPGYSERLYDEEEEGRWREGAMVQTSGRSGAWPEGADGSGTESKIESAAAACVLWSTIGVGCLVGGHPKSSVEVYAHLAREALTVCFDDGSVETARAFTSMALFQKVLGNEDLYNKYIQFAMSITSGLPPEKVPTDLADSNLFVEACDVFRSRRTLTEIATTVENGYESCTSMVKDPRIFQQAELCRWLLKTDIRMSACFAMDMHQQGAFKEKRYTPSAGSASSGPVGGGGTIKVGDRDDELSMARPPHAMCDEGEAEENAARNNCRHGSNVLDSAPQPPLPGEMSRKFAADVSPECHLLLNATQSPNVRGGVGELFFRTIMAYAAALQAQGDCSRAMKCLMPCSEIFVKSPGLCRFRTHLVHCVLACMVLGGVTDKYEELRDVLNSVIDDGDLSFVRIPPMEEWRGMSCICDHIFCRSLYRFLTMAPVPTGEPPGSSDDSAVLFTPSSIDEGAGMGMKMGSSMETHVSPSASEESWARGILDGRRPPAYPGGTEGPVSQAPPAAAAIIVPSAESAPTTYPESGFVGAFGAGSVPVAHQPGTEEMREGSPVVSKATGSYSSSSSNGIGPVEVGAGANPAEAVAPLPPPPGATANRADQNTALLPPLSSVPSPSAKLNDSAAGGERAEETGDLELLDASEMGGAIDALLGEGILEGFGEEGSGEEDFLPLLHGIFSDG